jgi:hypothetical protein
MNYRAWVKNQSGMARALELGALGGSYAEGAIILCSAISAMSSLLWIPSERTDKKRFTELVVHNSVGGPDTTRVSAPLFAKAYPQLSRALGVSEKSFYMTGRNDMKEPEVIAAATAAGIAVTKQQVRRYSYSLLLYEQVRCGFVHEYQPGKSATDADQLREIAGVATNEISYANTLVQETGDWISERLIHFPLGWISEVALAVAATMDDECTRQSKHPLENLGLPLPNSWWSEGG